MAIFTCKICGESVDSEHYIPETEKKLVENQICTTCLHWKEQHELDQTERGEHNFAIINGLTICLERLRHDRGKSDSIRAIIINTHKCAESNAQATRKTPKHIA